MTRAEEIINKVPLAIMLFAFLSYLSWDYYDFLNAPESALGQKNAELAETKAALDVAKRKLLIGQEFFKNLDSIRARIRGLYQQLENTKSSLTHEVDIANFIRMLTLEAKKVGLTIKGIKPENEVKKEYYVEIPFSVQIHGAYVQAMVFFDRIVRLQQLIRVVGFEMKPVGSSNAKYVELDGAGRILTYKYLGSSADDILQQDWMKSNEDGLKRIQEAQKDPKKSQEVKREVSTPQN